MSDKLYHYTNSAGLIGILDSKCLWASDCRFLNDSREFTHSRELLEKILGEAESKDYNRMAVLNAVDEIVARLNDVHSTFVICFTELHDSLDQWRSYGRGVGGYCLGFDRADLEESIKHSDFELKACVYDLATQRAALTPLIETLECSIRNSNHATLDKSALRKIIGNFVRDFFIIAPTLKHHAFVSEKEHRLISKPDAGLQKKKEFRAGKSFLIPYATLELLPIASSLREVIVGPTPHPELAVVSVKHLLKQNEILGGKNGPTVLSSKVPYRDW